MELLKSMHLNMSFQEPLAAKNRRESGLNFDLGPYYSTMLCHLESFLRFGTLRSISLLAERFSTPARCYDVSVNFLSCKITRLFKRSLKAAARHVLFGQYFWRFYGAIIEKKWELTVDKENKCNTRLPVETSRKEKPELTTPRSSLQLQGASGSQC